MNKESKALNETVNNISQIIRITVAISFYLIIDERSHKRIAIYFKISQRIPDPDV